MPWTDTHTHTQNSHLTLYTPRPIQCVHQLTTEYCRRINKWKTKTSDDAHKKKRVGGEENLSSLAIVSNHPIDPTNQPPPWLKLLEATVTMERNPRMRESTHPAHVTRLHHGQGGTRHPRRYTHNLKQTHARTHASGQVHTVHIPFITVRAWQHQTVIRH